MFPATTTNATDTRCNGGKQREVEREWETAAREGESESRGGEEKGRTELFGFGVEGKRRE